MRRLLLQLLCMLGFASLSGSLLLPWFQVPQAATHQPRLFPPVTPIPGEGTAIFRTLLILLLLAGLACWFGRQKRRDLATMAAAMAIVVVLFYPHFSNGLATRTDRSRDVVAHPA